MGNLSMLERRNIIALCMVLQHTCTCDFQAKLISAWSFTVDNSQAEQRYNITLRKTESKQACPSEVISSPEFTLPANWGQSDPLAPSYSKNVNRRVLEIERQTK